MAIWKCPCLTLIAVMSCLDAKISLVPKHQLIVPPTLLVPATHIHTEKATNPQRYIRSNHWHMSYFFKIAKKQSLTGGFILFCYLNVSNTILIFKFKITTNAQQITIQFKLEMKLIVCDDMSTINPLLSPSVGFSFKPIWGGGRIWERGAHLI